MSDIVGRGQVWLLLPYARGTGGPPILVISHLTRLSAPPSPPSGTILPPQGPILEERKREDRRVCKWE